MLETSDEDFNVAIYIYLLTPKIYNKRARNPKEILELKYNAIKILKTIAKFELVLI